MKKVLVAGAALMLVSGIASTASAAAVEPGVKITGDARVRIGYTDEDYIGQNRFGNRTGYESNTNMDSRVRVNIAGTAAGGAYAKARFRMEGGSGDIDNDPGTNEQPIASQSNLWADLAYIGIPFNDTVTVELGRYRSTYGPLGTTFNFAYDDVSSYGAKGIIKFGGVELNPFVEWMEDGQNGEYVRTFTVVSGAVPPLVNTNDLREVANSDDDVMRYGIHAKGKINKDWTVGGMLGYQSDERRETWNAVNTFQTFEPNEGMFGSIYVSGKAGAFGLNAELAFTDAELNNFNSWETDTWVVYNTPLATTQNNALDLIGSQDTGFGGYVFPTYTIDKLTLGLNLGFTTNGYQPDRAFGTGVMIGSSDNSRISAIRIGDFGDWLWAGLVAQYQFTEALKLTGNFMYADIDAWDTKGVAGDGPNTSSGSIAYVSGANANPTGANPQITGAWELSAILQYTISKGMDVYLSAGYLQPDTEAGLQDDGVFGALSRFELKF